MKEYKLYQSEYPYHIYNRTNNKEFFFQLHRDAPAIMTCLQEVTKRTTFRPHHFIVISNHYHLVATTPESNLHEIMRLFQTMVSKVICKNHNRINHIFGSRYSATVVETPGYLRGLIRYGYQNAVTSGLASSPLGYPHSTLKYYLSDTWKENSLFLDPVLEKMTPEERKKFLLEYVCGLPMDRKEERFCRLKLRKLKI